MPYSITTKDGITINNIPDDVPPDAPELKARVQAIRAGNPEALQPKGGFVDAVKAIPGAIKEAVTGSQRSTPTAEALPDWAGMPELNTFSLASAKTGLGTLMSNPEETVQVIKSNFPGVQVRQDEKGNYLLRSSIDGNEYAIKPGFRVSDVPRAIGAVAAFTPAGRATSVLGAGTAAAATQAVIEGTQAATGGDFSPGEVATAGALGAAVPAVVQTGKAILDSLKPYAQNVMAGVRGTQPAQRAAQAARPSAPAQPVTPPVAPPAVQVMPADELAQTARSAAEGGLGSRRATKVLAEQAMPDPVVVASAKRLGVQDYLQPDHVTSNQAYRELAQAVKSVPGSQARTAELQGLEEVAARASRLIDEIGGTSDISTLAPAVRRGMQETHDALVQKADDYYRMVREAVPAKSPIYADTTLAAIYKRADDLGGEQFLSPLEKRVLQVLGDADAPPTYARLDDLRKQLNAAKYGKAEEAFVAADDALRNSVLSTLRADQKVAADAFGQSATWELAQQSARAYKGVQDDMTALFGKALDGTFVGTGANSLQGAVKAASQGDATKIAKLMASVPKEMRETVAASGIGQMFRTAATRGELNPTAYAKWYEGLKRNRQAYTAVMANLPLSSRKQLEALYRVTNGISKASKERILTGRIQAVQQELQGADGLMASLYSVAKRSAIGVPVEVATTAVGLPGAGISASVASALTKGTKPSALKAADELIASPEFLQAVKQAATPGAKTAARKFAYSRPFTKLYEALGKPAEMSDREQWVMRALQTQQMQAEEPVPAQ